MNFFDYIKNDAFFKPLTSKYKSIYYDCIQILIDKTKEMPVLYESDARDSIMIYLNNHNVNKSDESIGLDDMLEEGNVELQPGMMIALFRECGWILPREIGRNGEYVTNVATDCRRFMDFLRKMTEKSGEGMMSNRIFSMYEIMKSVFEEESIRRERPYTNVLVPLVNNESELKNELTDLKDNISNIMKCVITFQDINSFGQFIMKDQMLDRFFNEYFFVKNNGLIPVQIFYIRSKLRLLRQDDYFGKMVVECAEKLQISPEDAGEKIERDFAELQHFLSIEYDENMELIDRRINNYYNLANTRIMLMASNGIKLESVINDFLNMLSRLGSEDQAIALEKVTDCVRIMNQQYIGYRSFEKRKRLSNEGDNIGLVIEAFSEEEKKRRTEMIFENAANKYSVERVRDFLAIQMESEGKICLKEQKIKSKEEVLMYAAAMLYAENEEFPYEIELSSEIVRTELADISNIIISKKNEVEK